MTYKEQAAQEVQEAAQGKLTPEQWREMLQSSLTAQDRDNITAMHDLLKQLADSIAASKQPGGAVYTMRQAWATFSENAAAIAAGLQEFSELAPYIEAELKKPEYAEISTDAFADLLAESTDENGELIPGSTWGKIIAAAKDAQSKTATPAATITRATKIEMPVDKVNSVIWSLIKVDTQGQLAIKTEKQGSKKEISILYSINFDELPDNVKITKRLDAFDKRVYIAVSALFNAGNNFITLTQIHYAMGNKTRPAQNQLKKINDAIRKMNGAFITINNIQEIEAKYNYPAYKYEGSLLPLERMEASVNGQLSEAAIHIFREPPMLTFAKQRQQITTIPVKLLQSPVSKTDDNLRLEDYLLDRICRAARGKTGKTQERILYKKLYEKAGITTTKQKLRAPGKIERYLEFYVSEGFIKSYTTDSDGLTVFL